MKSFLKFLVEFNYIWVLLIAMALVAYFTHDVGARCFTLFSIDVTFIGIILALVTCLLLIRPMNAVYGLMGTSGSIQVFLINFILISCIFSATYFWGFFSEAGVSYDVTQPHIDYCMYAHDDRPAQDGSTTRILVVRDTSYSYAIGKAEAKIDTTVEVSAETLHYQPITLGFVLRNTIMTSLMQEPTDFFAAAATFNEGMEGREVVKSVQEIQIDGAVCPYDLPI